MNLANKANLPYCCGVDVVGDFHSGSDGNRFLRATNSISRVTTSGTGMMVATFTNTVAQHAAYEELKEKWDILFQSKPMRNRYSRNKVFLVVYGPKKRTKKKEVKEGASASWPAPTERRGEKLPAF